MSQASRSTLQSGLGDRKTDLISEKPNIKNINLSDPAGWSIWPCALVRTAGMPASWVLRLAAHDAALAADHWLEAEQRVAAARDEALERLRRLPDSDHRAATSRAARKLLKNQVPESCPVPLDDWLAARAAAAEARARFDDVFITGRKVVKMRLRELAAEPLIRAAMTWQNHAASRCILDKLVESSSERDDSKTRQRELSATSYVQRYCVKNDTIGFFGPTCWARVGSDGPALTHLPGGRLMASQEVFFEDWAISELCRALDQRVNLRPWLRPRRIPAVGLVGNDAYMLTAEPMHLSAVEARILTLCDGRKRAKQIAAEVLDQLRGAVSTEEDVFAALDGLCKRGLAVWRVETIMSMRSIALLRELLEGVEDPALRAQALAPLDQLEAARKRVEEANGADALLAALDDLDRVFSSVTGKPASHKAGKMYAARTLVFLDGCRTDQIAIGPGVLQRLTPVLSILMHAARWFTHRVAREYRAALGAAHMQVTEQMNTPEVPFLRMWLAAQHLFPLSGQKTPEPMREAIAALRERWKEVLQAPAEPKQALHYDGATLVGRAREVFAADAPGWSLARHHGPDIMIAARSVEAIERGDMQIVLGEFHCGINTSTLSSALTQHPQIQDIFQLWEKDFPEPCVLPSPPRESFPVRINRELATAKDYRLEWAPDIAGPPAATRLAAGDLVVVNDEGRLRVRMRDGSLSFDIIEFFGQALSGICPYYFELPGGELQHKPRLTIDSVVVTREQWRLPVSTFDFYLAERHGDRFARARAWSKSHGMPRFCFVRTRFEDKPIYVDFASPLYVDLLAQLCRNANKRDPQSVISFSEMLPDHEQLWLGDRDDNRYTAEIRLVAVDPRVPEAADRAASATDGSRSRTP